MSTKRIRHAGLPKHLNSWIPLDSRGMPRYWAIVWESLHGGDLEASTLGAKLTSINRFYRHVEEVSGDDVLDRLIANADVDRLELLLESFFSKIRNEAAQTQSDRSGEWAAAFEFIRDLVDRQGRIRDADSLDIFQARMLRLNRLYSSLTPSRPAKRKVVRALPAAVIEDIYDIVDPASARNPFRSEAQRWRNYSLFLLYLHQGLRRGEALILPLNAIKAELDRKTGETVHWINVIETEDEDGLQDPRRERPSIKTFKSRRQIPISEDLADTVTHYVDNYRGKQSHIYLFPSNRNTPLAIRSVNAIFDVLSSRLSEAARKELRDHLREETVSPHDLRHTAAVYRLSQFIDDGMEMELALQLLRSFFGWEKSSKMPQHYANAYFENRLKSVWQNRFDERVKVLRTLKALGGSLVKGLR